MTKISSREFKEQFKQGVKNDAATQERLTKAGANGKEVLNAADANKDGTVAGDAELDTLFKKLDDHDRDGRRSTISGAKPLGMIAALKAPPEPEAPAGVSTDSIYAPDADTLAKGAKGPEVKDAQQKLIKAGYELPRFGADGKFGSETETAVKQFQRDNKLPETGTLDPTSLEKLQNAKPASNVKFPEYGQMYKDGVLQTTIGIGFDEDGNDIALKQNVLQGLQERNFEKLDVKNMTDAQLKERGFDPAQIDRNATYFTKTFQHDGKDVKALVKLVDRNTPDAKEQFSKGMKNDDLIIYGGHARRGSGPDFDHANSDKGNYVVGRPYEDGHYKLGKNDLSKPGALSDNYQLMLFDACQSRDYVDDLRSRPKNKTTENLDVVASTRTLPWSTGTADTFAMLDGVMQGKSINDIKASLDQINAVPGKGDAFIANGFRDNPTR